MDVEEDTVYWIGVRGYSNWKKLAQWMEKSIGIEPGNICMKEEII